MGGLGLSEQCCRWLGGLSNVNMTSQDAFVRLLLVLEWKTFLSSIAVKETKKKTYTATIMYLHLFPHHFSSDPFFTPVFLSLCFINFLPIFQPSLFYYNRVISGGLTYVKRSVFQQQWDLNECKSNTSKRSVYTGCPFHLILTRQL